MTTCGHRITVIDCLILDMDTLVITVSLAKQTYRVVRYGEVWVVWVQRASHFVLHGFNISRVSYCICSTPVFRPIHILTLTTGEFHCSISFEPEFICRKLSHCYSSNLNRRYFSNSTIHRTPSSLHYHRHNHYLPLSSYFLLRTQSPSS